MGRSDIALGNAIHRQGIDRVQGDILVVDKFYMNFEEQPQIAGELFQQAIDYQQWHLEVTQQYLQMPMGTEQPKVETREVKQIDRLPQEAKLIIRHRSLPLGEILRQMNIYSNNKMAQMLADAVGGADEVARYSAKIAGFPTEEIELINGSGLGEANRISPRAVCRMLMAIDRLLSSSSYSTADLFPTAGKDLVGTVQNRGLPLGTTIKTGTLDNVSALAGVIPRKERSPVYFSIINYGRPVKYFRQQQDSLLNELAQTWQLAPPDSYLAQKPQWYLGNPQRNKLY